MCLEPARRVQPSHAVLVLVSLLCALPALASPPEATPAHGRLDRLAGLDFGSLPARPVEVWLPPGYPRQAPYGLLLMFDGQMLFDPSTTWNGQAWHADMAAVEAVDRLGARPFIIVGVWNPGAQRGSEYLPEQPFASLSADARQRQLQAARADGQAHLLQAPYSDALVGFLADELLPRLQREYALDADPRRHCLAGSSMGGLIALYALALRPEVFGCAAGLSVHWPGGFLLDDPELPTALVQWMAMHLPGPGTHRLHIDHGSEGLEAHYHAWQDALHGALRARGFDSAALSVRDYPGTGHSERDWAARLPAIMAWLMAP